MLAVRIRKSSELPTLLWIPNLSIFHLQFNRVHISQEAGMPPTDLSVIQNKFCPQTAWPLEVPCGTPLCLLQLWDAGWWGHLHQSHCCSSWQREEGTHWFLEPPLHCFCAMSLARVNHLPMPGKISLTLMCSELKNWYLWTARGPPYHSTAAHSCTLYSLVPESQ